MKVYSQEIMSKRVVSKELQLKIETVVLECLVKAQNKWGADKVNKIPTIKYNLSGRCAGRAHWIYVTNDMFIRINPILLNENVEYMLTNTVPHEIAHLVAYMVFGKSIKPHGYEWKTVMRCFGLTPDRCHYLNTSTVRSIRKPTVRKRYLGVCDYCSKELVMSSVIRNRIILGKKTYTHSECGGKVYLKDW